jgi:hypothetical protein
MTTVLLPGTFQQIVIQPQRRLAQRRVINDHYVISLLLIARAHRRLRDWRAGCSARRRYSSNSCQQAGPQRQVKDVPKTGQEHQNDHDAMITVTARETVRGVDITHLRSAAPARTACGQTYS